MKVLDPQSALLTNAEVYQFLKEQPPRKSAKRTGAYPKVNLQGYQTINQDFSSYTENVTPHITQYGPVQDWITNLIFELKPFNLTKTEVLTLINLGIGVKPQVETQTTNGETDDLTMTGEVPAGNHRLLFSLAVEEIDERFPGEEGEARIEEIMTIIRNTIQTISAPETRAKLATGDEGPDG